jgi:hypothetical protein
MAFEINGFELPKRLASGPRSKMPADASAKFLFRPDLRRVGLAIKKAIYQRADDSCPVQSRFAARASVDHETIELDDLSVEKHHGHFGPGFVMYWRTTTASALAAAGACSRHGHRL